MKKRDPQWIWYGDFGLDLVNSWMQARRVFDIPKIPKRALVNVTADARYRLWVNGEYVCRGPARGYQRSWPYDTVDLAPFLRTGKNAVCAIVHNYGISTFQYIHEDYAGFLFWGVAGPVDLSTNESWRVRPAPGYVRHMTRVSVQLGFSEIFDARLDDGSWMRAEYDDSAWGKPHCRPMGSMPWSGLEERGIPLLLEKPIAPASVVSKAEGACAVDWRSTVNIVDLHVRENPAWQSAPAAFVADNEAARIEIPASGEARFRAVCIDFGKEVVGSIRLAIDGATGDEVIDTIVTEGLDSMRPVVDPPGSPTNGFRCFGNRLFPRSGATRHEQYDHWGFRYLALIVRNSARPLSIGVGLRWTGYPLDVRASYATGDVVLDRIWEISAHTQQCCMLDAYIDCPWREQAQWWGDARVQVANTFFLSADARLARRGIRIMAGQETPDGLTYGHTPTMAHNCILPDFNLVWVLTHGDYYQQTGDLSLYRELSARMRRMLDYFDRSAASNGLLPYDQRYWLFLDWAPLFRDGYPTLYNLMYLSALQAARDLAQRAGDRTNARVYAGREKALARSVKQRLMDRKRRALFAGLDWKGKPVVQDAPHTYAWAVLTDLAPERNDRFSREYLLPVIAGHWRQKLTPSAFFIHYIFEACKKTGHGAEVIDCIRRWWGEVVAAGRSTTPEGFDAKPASASLCHAWSAHPVVHLSNVVLGIWQNAVGWKKIRFKPDFSAVDHADGAVATPLGPVRVSWKKSGGYIAVSLHLPRGMTADVELPGIKKRIVKGRTSMKVLI
jgi:hypothetical protein